MARLTTESSSREFNDDLDERLRDFPHLAGNLALEHRNRVMKKRGNTAYYVGTAAENPDTESFVVGFSMVASQLIRLAAKIEESENIVTDFDDEADQSELQHALGELFALKETYISFSSGMGALESARLKATDEGLTQKSFLSMVSQTPDGIPSDKQLTGPVFAGNSINGTSGLFNSSRAPKPLYTDWLVPKTPNNSSALSVKSPPASAAVPPIPPLV